MTNYKRIGSVKGIFISYETHGIIELTNDLIAVSSCSSGNPIVIIDAVKFSVLKEIKEQNYITHYSSLCLLNENSFIYSDEGNVIQIAINEDYKISFKSNSEKQLNGYRTFISIDNGKFVIIENKSNGIDIIKPN